jgi:hypothetical protein
LLEEVMIALWAFCCFCLRRAGQKVPVRQFKAEAVPN